jgi:hypothetical protein
VTHRNNETDREFPEGQEYLILVPGFRKRVRVWATSEAEAIEAARGITETDGRLYQ